VDSAVCELMFSEEKNSDSKLWATPRSLITSIEDHFQVRFTLDAAATRASRVCRRYFGPDHEVEQYRDAMELSWFPSGGVPNEPAIWLNPPYGRGLGDWMCKAKEESWSGNSIYCLVPARTDTKWWHDNVMAGAREVHFIRGRVKFAHPETLVPYKNAAPFPSALVVYRGVCAVPTFWSLGV
jgi:phage N-6-adenine-methyltransferase